MIRGIPTRNPVRGWVYLCLVLTTVTQMACSALTPFPNTEEHIVVKGDTLYSIAWRYELDYRDLAAWNHIPLPYTIYPGQALRLHPFSQRSSPHADPATTASQNGDDDREIQPDGLQTQAASAPSSHGVRRLQPKVRPITPEPAPIIVQESPASEPADKSASPAATMAQPSKVALPERETPSVADTPTVKPVDETTRQAKAKPAVSLPKPTLPKPAPPPEETPPPTTRNGWGWPTHGTIKQGYSAASTGIMISGKQGQPVYSVRKGKVVYAGSGLKGYGLLVIVKHSDEYLSAYGNNQRLLVTQGEEIRLGQKIATMGLGPENQPSLHFELRRNGKPVNPTGLLPVPK